MPVSVGPESLAVAGRSASDYIAVYERLWPVAVTGGIMGVIIHSSDIVKAKSKLSAICLTATEWTVGASAAMVLATLLPSISELLPDGINLATPAAELGLCGFIGGTFGRQVFRWIWSKLFRSSGERGDRQ